MPQADIVIPGSDIRSIVTARSIARLVRYKIRENTVWSFVAAWLVMFSAALGLVRPVTAQVLMIVSSCIVLANSIGMRNVKIEVY